MLRINLVDSTGNTELIPEGTKITINNQTYNSENGVLQLKLLENISSEEIVQVLNMQLDMSELLPQNRLKTGEYTLEIEVALVEDEVSENNIQDVLEVPIVIENTSEKTYGLKAEILNETAIEADKLQLIQKEEIQEGQTEERKVKLQYEGSFEEAKVKIKTLERTGPFAYEETEDSNKIDISIEEATTNEITTLEEEQEIVLSFGSEMKGGTYRIVFELYDKYNKKRTECLVNNIVEE